MRQLIGLAASLLLLSFSLPASNNPIHVDEYISTYSAIAKREMQRSGIPASIILAQGIHESAWGRGPLAVQSNNHFGIKCKDYWEGPYFYIEDDDYVDGTLVKSCFRSYESVEASYVDHTDFLLKTNYYQDLFDFDQTDYINWAKGLKQCGYATDPLYTEKLINIIERYDLFELDQVKVLAMEAPVFYIPAEHLNQGSTVVSANFTEHSGTDSMQSYTPAESKWMESSTAFDYEINSTSLPTTENNDLPLHTYPHERYSLEPVGNNTYTGPRTAVIPNSTTNDQKLKNLSRKPRMSTAAGPR